MIQGLALPVLSGLLLFQATPELVVSAGHAGPPHHAAFVGPYLVTAVWSNVALVDLSTGLTAAHLPQGSLVMTVEGSRAEDLLAVGTCGNAIQLWDVHSRTLVHRIALEQECAESVSFSPDGSLLATGGYSCCGSGKGVQVWSVRTGELVRVFSEDTGMRHVVFSGDGRWVAGVDDEGTATLFEWPSGRVLRRIVGFEDAGILESSVIASPDGKYFAWAGPATGLHVWDVASGNEVPPLPRGDGRAASRRERARGWSQDLFPAPAFLDDGRFAHMEGGQRVVTRLPDGLQERISIDEPESGALEDVRMMRPLTLRRDASLVAGVLETRTVVWDVTARRAYEPTAPALVSPTSLRWNGPSGIVAWVDLESGVRGWDDRRGGLVDFGDGLDVADAIALDRDGKRLAIAGLSSVVVLDLPRRRRVASLESGPSAGTAVAFSPDGARLAFASPARGFALFDRRLRLRGTLAALEESTSVKHVSFSPDGQWIAAGLSGAHPAFRVWPAVESGSRPAIELDSNRVTYGPQPPAFSSDSRWLASFRRGRSLTIWRTGSWEVARTWALSGTGRALAFAPEGTLLAVASDGEAAIWDAETGEKVVSFSTPGSAEMEEIAWSPEGDRVVTSADDGVLRFWNSDDGRLLASLYVLDSGGDWLLVSPDGRVDGTDRALTRLVAWRVRERVAPDRRLTEQHRARELWRSLRSSSRP